MIPWAVSVQLFAYRQVSDPALFLLSCARENFVEKIHHLILRHVGKSKIRAAGLLLKVSIS